MFSYDQVKKCNNLFAIDPSAYNPKTYPPGVIAFIVPKQVSIDKPLFDY